MEINHISRKKHIDELKCKLITDYKDRTNIIPNATTYEVPEGSKYLSDFLEDLPHDCFFNKVVTGCGGTTLALTNKENYIVTVHSLNVVKNKSEQHSNILGVHGEMSNDSIIKYLFDYKDSPKKFIVTYDSLPRLIDVIENNSKCEVSDFRLLVDEVQVLIRNLGGFKVSVANNLIENTYKFKSICYLTATPTNLRYLPEPIKKLEYIELEWPNVNKAVINHCKVGKQFNTKLTALIIDKYKNTNDDIYVFYNSKFGVVSLIKNLVSLSYINISDIEIIFADNKANSTYFKNNLNKVQRGYSLGYSLEVDSEGNPVDSNRKRIKFISSFGFEGVDFYSFGRDVTTIIAADAASKSMRYDISIDIPQILGRIRRDKKTGLFPKNDIYFIWKTMEEIIQFDNEDEIINYIGSKVSFYSEIVETGKCYDFSSVDGIYKNMDPFVVFDGESYIQNKYAMEAILSAYSVLNVDYNIIHNSIDYDNRVRNSLMSIYENVNNFEIPELTTTESISLERKTSFLKSAYAYYEEKNKLNLLDPGSLEYNESIEILDLIKSSHELLDEAIDVIGIDNIIKAGANSKKIKTKVDHANSISLIRSNYKKYGIEENCGFVLNEDLMPIICNMYSDTNLSGVPKTTFICEIFHAKKKYINGKPGYEIGDKK